MVAVSLKKKSKEKKEVVSSDNHPLVTMALFAYNQEKFIEEAVQGVLSQTYSPLQVILSDDCSSDNTFSIVEKMADENDGPHEIVLNRNSENLGIGGHINRVMELAVGDIIVVAAGDDVSYPMRVEHIVRYFVRFPDCMAVYSHHQRIDVNGCLLDIQRSINRTTRENIADAVTHWCPGVLGASHAWRRQLFEVFGPLNPRIMTEDRALPLRAVLLGEIRCLPQPLIKYRIHSLGISQVVADGDLVKYFYKQAATWRQGMEVLRGYKKDLARYICLYGEETDIVEAQKRVSEQMPKAYVHWKFYRSDSYLEKLQLLFWWLLHAGDWKQAVRFFALIFLPDFYMRKLAKQNLIRNKK